MPNKRSVYKHLEGQTYKDAVFMEDNFGLAPNQVLRALSMGLTPADGRDVIYTRLGEPNLIAKKYPSYKDIKEQARQHNNNQRKKRQEEEQKAEEIQEKLSEASNLANPFAKVSTIEAIKDEVPNLARVAQAAAVAATTKDPISIANLISEVPQFYESVSKIKDTFDITDQIDEKLNSKEPPNDILDSLHDPYQAYITGSTGNVKDQGNGIITYSGIEYISDVIGSTSTVLQLTKFVLNPAYLVTFPYSASISSNFIKYRFKKFIVKYKPLSSNALSSSSTNLGIVILGYDKDTTLPQPTSRVQLENKYGSVSIVPSQDTEMNIPIDENWRYCKMNPNFEIDQDSRLNHFANLYIGVQNQPFGNIIGQLYFDFELELSQNVLTNGVTYRQNLYWDSKLWYRSLTWDSWLPGPTSSSSDYGGEYISGNLKLTFPANNIIQFPDTAIGANWFVLWQYNSINGNFSSNSANVPILTPNSSMIGLNILAGTGGNRVYQRRYTDVSGASCYSGLSIGCFSQIGTGAQITVTQQGSQVPLLSTNSGGTLKIFPLSSDMVSYTSFSALEP